MAASQPRSKNPPPGGPKLLTGSNQGGTSRRPRGLGRREGPVEDELAAVRRRKAQERATVARYVDSRIDSLEYQESYCVSRLYVLVAGSLGPGHLLSLVASWSDGAYANSGSPWVRRSVQEWVNHSGLPEDEWMGAREMLREQGLIEERRRYDLEADEIVVEIAFVPDAFAKRVAALREEVRAEAWERLRAGQTL